jgi:uncharacterized protein YbcC (UPF0753/DUF2309 family)
MSTDGAIEERIDAAAETVGAVWPLHSFVTANPLAGFEDQPFEDAIADATRHLGGDGYPSPAVFREAWEDGRIDPEILRRQLDANGLDPTPAESLERMEREAATEQTDTPKAGAQTAGDRVDAVLSKWLSAFLDEGQAKWSMPHRERGFYDAFRRLARHDGDIPNASAIADLPADPIAAIRRQLDDHPVGEWAAIFEDQLSALPGWSGFLKRRAADDDAWQAAHPITLPGYLAVRLTLVDLFDAPIGSPNAQESAGPDEGSDAEIPLQAVWLRAWEATYRGNVVDALSAESAGIEHSRSSADDGVGERPDAQLVFCIDTRSEIIRRHVEAAGDYETHGYAGFFGVPMRHVGYDSAVTADACPPILDPEHRIEEQPTEREGGRQDRHDRWTSTLGAGKRALTRLRSNATTAFSFVESTGAAYGAAMAARTLLPERVHDLRAWCHEQVPDVHAFCDPALDRNPDADADLPAGLTLSEQVEYAAAAFETMGWDRFARLVVFAGHASETANNPFDSSLDCGACAGNPGGPNARVLAAICNDEAVRERLAERGIDVPDDTVFLAAEHNTTTDEVELFDAEVPESHAPDLEQLRSDLETARAGAAAERASDMGAGIDTDGEAVVRETERRAADWAETRPEWGLAGNAGFVIGPRELTSGLDLDGRAFLHSYDWRRDPEGEALEAILTGPMVVTQWINTQYYFATVDPAGFGSGSKVTQNPVGNVGVYQGNGGDLMGGLPLESLYSAHDEPYHQPLRLSTVVHAPAERVEAVLADHDKVRELLDNEWLSLSVVDPEQEHRTFHYDGELEWRPLSAADSQSTPEVALPAAADD